MGDDRQNNPNPGYSEYPQEENERYYNDYGYGQGVNNQNNYYGNDYSDGPNPNPGYSEYPQEENERYYNDYGYGQGANNQNNYYGNDYSEEPNPNKKKNKLLVIGLSILLVLGIGFALAKSGILPFFSGASSSAEKMIENTVKDFKESTVNFFGDKAAKVVDSAKGNMEFKVNVDTTFGKINFKALSNLKEKTAEISLDAQTGDNTYKGVIQAKENDLYLSVPEVLEKAIKFDATKLGKQLIDSGLIEDEKSKKEIEDLSINLWSRPKDSDLSYKHTSKQLSKMATEEGKSSKEFQIGDKNIKLDLKKVSLDMKQLPDLIEAAKKDVKESAALKGNEESIQKYLDNLKTEFEESNKYESNEVTIEYAQYQGKLAYGNIHFKSEDKNENLILTFKGKEHLSDEFILEFIDDDGKVSSVEKTVEIGKDKRTMNFSIHSDRKDIGSFGLELDYANKKFSILAGKNPVLMGDLISEDDRIGLAISGESMGLPIDLNIEITLGQIKSAFTDLPKEVQKAEDMKKEDWEGLLKQIKDKFAGKKENITY